MKKIIVMLTLVLVGLKLAGQTGPVFPYDNPTKQKLYDLASENSPKGKAYLSYLVDVINFGLKDTTCVVSANPEFIMAHLYWEEIYLKEGGYKNSGYDSISKKMHPSLGHKWTGFGWVFRIGTHSVPIMKGDCGNVVKIIPVTIPKKKNEEVVVPEVKTETSFGLKPTPLTEIPKVDLGKPDLPKDIGSSVITKPLAENKVSEPLLPPVVKKNPLPWIIAGTAAVLIGTGIYFLVHRLSGESGEIGGPVGVPVHWD